jgi:Raf kinase inhibitor-like YbhB/YbcL family protein
MRKSLAALAAALAAVAGCAGGQGAQQVAAPSPTPADRLTVTSTAYPDGGTVPRRFTCDGADVSPPLTLRGVPTGTVSLALLLQDLDAPHGTFTHWLMWNLGPHTTRLSADERPRGVAEGRNSFGRTGYNGPCPPHGDRPHRYVLTVYATDRRPSLAPGATPTDLLRTLSAHTLAEGTLTGRYGR